MPKVRSPRPRANARRVGLVARTTLAALPFACSVYDASDLQSWEPAEAGRGGTQNPASGAAGSATVGATHSGGTSHGGGGSSAAGNGGTSGASSTGGVATSGAGGNGSASSGAPPEGGSGPTEAAGAGGSDAGDAGAAGAGMTEPPVITGLVASYPFERANGSVLADASGNGRSARLANGAGGSAVGFGFSAGVVGNALSLSPTDQAYVSLPRGIVSQLSEMTIATWVKVKSDTAFQRIFDFGIDTKTFMYLVSSSSNGVVRFRMAAPSLNKNQVVEGAKSVPVGKWAHVTVTVGDNGAAIYLDGAQIAQQAPAAVRPSELGDTVNNYIGRSPFPTDPYLDGQVDEFRIYDRVLSPLEIAELAKEH